MSTPQVVTLVTAFVSALLAILAGIDPGGVLARPEMQQAVIAVFAAAVPLGLYLWAYFHHQQSKM